MTFTEDYDPGFVNAPGFGQSATNPLAPVFYTSLGVVEDVSVYGSIYSANNIQANLSFTIGGSSLTQELLNVAVPSLFREPIQSEETVTCQKDIKVLDVTDTNRLIVNGVEYREGVIAGKNGSFRVLMKI